MRVVLPAFPTQHTRLVHPAHGGPSFGIVPVMAFAGATFPQGAIFLPYGRRAFGATHILARHQKEMESKGFSGLAEVPDFVATILRPRAPFFFEGGLDRKSRLAVVQSMSGTVILQLLEPTELAAHYSVVTAYLGFVKHGRRIGALL